MRRERDIQNPDGRRFVLNRAKEVLETARGKGLTSKTDKQRHWLSATVRPAQKYLKKGKNEDDANGKAAALRFARTALAQARTDNNQSEEKSIIIFMGKLNEQ